jgi:hypothetical protein
MADEDDNASKDEGKEKKDKNVSADAEDATTHRTSPGWATKTLRVFLFATVGAFLAAFLFGDPLPNGLRVDFDLAASIKLGLIAGVISAVLRALVSFLPVFPDD